MVVTMYKGSSECIADKDQLLVMINAGWSRTKPVPKKKAPPVEKVEVVETPEVKTTKKPTKPAEVASTTPRKKPSIKKRRSVK